MVMLKAMVAGLMLASGPSQGEGFHAYTWSPVPEDCTRLTHMVWFREDSDPAAIAVEALSRPEGRRALFSWDMHRLLLQHPEDVCRTPDGRSTEFRGVWPEHGVEAVRARFEQFFRGFRDAGGDADWLILDFEEGFSNWALGGTDNRERWLAIQEDPRFAELERQLGFGDLMTVADFRSGPNYLKWNAVAAAIADRALSRATFEPARRFFPDFQCSNYGTAVVRREDAVPDLNGHMQWHEGPGFGTHQAPSFYTWIGQLADRNLDGERPFGQSPFAGLLLAVNEARAIRRSSPAPLQPWVAWHRYKGDGPDRPPATVAGTPYYGELVRHLALAGATEFLLWNPHPWGQDQDPQDLSLPEDERLLDGLLAELDGKLGPGERKAMAVEPIPWDATVIASACRLNGQIVWRLTLAGDRTGVAIELEGGRRTLKPPPGEVGVWFTHPADQKLVIGE